ncbi:hypothetical protein QYE76_025643 [Lolium multiflorum]|uniref:DDE Tnp4 domain-containing protein n=1 Tax=Lolium multiflorum TaxID=4521 RepID=A0AAD8RG60_LOLMU|nr:hypothetical protein QYE76_025643 [Lolium multiflorum]
MRVWAVSARPSVRFGKPSSRTGSIAAGRKGEQNFVGKKKRWRKRHSERSTKTISQYFQQVLFAIGELKGEMIKPASMNTTLKIKNSCRWFPYFRDCIGAIDGTHVTIKVPRSMSAAFRGRKYYTSQNVLAAVDFDMRFTYVLARWEASAHDASILADSLSRPDGLQIPNGKFYLGDVGYACRPRILPPFRKTRYHLNEFSASNDLNTTELFNLRHSSLRVAMERAFAALKNRFKVLDQKPFHTFDTQVKLVISCCILHNCILGWGEEEFFEEVVITSDEVETGHGVDAGDNDA